MALNIYLPIITLNVNGLNVPTKRHKVAECIRKQDPYICCLQETRHKSKDTEKKVKGGKRYFMQMERKNKLGVVILITNKIEFNVKATVRDKEGYYVMIKGTIQRENITLVNTYTPNTGAPKYVKQILMDIREEINRK